jgi:fatty-acyl-CoA synthase
VFAFAKKNPAAMRALELAKCVRDGLQAQRLSHLRCVICMDVQPGPGMFNLHDVMALGNAQSIADAQQVGLTLDRNDAVNLLFTSGTTGHPKGATLTHRNIVNNAIAVGAAMGFSTNDKLCIPVSMQHCFGMVMGSLACAVTGGTMVFSAEGV